MSMKSHNNCWANLNNINCRSIYCQSLVIISVKVWYIGKAYPQKRVICWNEHACHLNGLTCEKSHFSFKLFNGFKMSELENEQQILLDFYSTEHPSLMKHNFQTTCISFNHLYSVEPPFCWLLFFEHIELVRNLETKQTFIKLFCTYLCLNRITEVPALWGMCQ